MGTGNWIQSTRGHRGSIWFQIVTERDLRPRRSEGGKKCLRLSIVPMDEDQRAGEDRGSSETGEALYLTEI